MTSTSPAPQFLRPLKEHLRDPNTRSALQIQRVIIQAAREYLTSVGYVELLAPIVGIATHPTAPTAPPVELDYQGHRYRPITTSTLYKQVALLSFDKVFFIAPNVRVQPVAPGATPMHLAEFHQIDVEIAHAHRALALSVAQGVISAALCAVAVHCAPDLTLLGRRTLDLLVWAANDFAECTHHDAVSVLEEHGHRHDRSTEIGWESQLLLSHELDRPTFIVDHPKGARGFHIRENTSAPNTLTSFDLIAPDGFGKIATGGERENNRAKIVARMHEAGEKPEDYGWYLDVAHSGVPPSAGFGIGVEPLTRFIANLEHLWQASAYPRITTEISW